MPTGARPTSTLPPEHDSTAASSTPAAAGDPANLELFERAFAAAAAATQLGSAPPPAITHGRGQSTHSLPSRIAGIGTAVFEALAAWLEPRCTDCGARGTVAMELRVVAVGEASQLWERCYACGASWASARCDAYSGWC
jgi:hypothetical protein